MKRLTIASACAAMSVCTAFADPASPEASRQTNESAMILMGPVPSPAALNPALDVVLIESREKVSDRQWLAERGGDAAKKGPSAAWLGDQAKQGDIRAAVFVADEKRSGTATSSEAVDPASLEAVYDQGMAAGFAKAFLAKAEIEFRRGETKSAVAHLAEASRRGCADADYQLAVYKAQRPDAVEIKDGPAVLLGRAADRGSATAALTLGLALLRGSWVLDPAHIVVGTKSPELAAAWMERARLLGSPEATLWCGLHLMRVAEGLIDPAREKAVQCLLTARQMGSAVKDPVSGLTFDELMAAGRIEPGFVAEILRREAQVKKDRAQSGSTISDPDKKLATGAAIRPLHIDHAVFSLVGDASGSSPVYNLVGLSPYREIGFECTVEAQADAPALPAKMVPELKAGPGGWRIEVIADGKPSNSVSLTAAQWNAVTMRSAKPDAGNPSRATQYRIVRYHTFYSLFGGDNRLGLKPGENAGTADEVWAYEAQGLAVRQLYFHATQRQWVDSRTGAALAADFELAPGAGLWVKRMEAGTLVFQARGMLPEQDFDFSPASEINVVSLRKNALTAALSRASSAVAKAGDLPVLSNKNGRWAAIAKAPANWWTGVGLRAADLVNIPEGSAAVLVNN